MPVLKGNNLPERQKELNIRVREATEEKISFDAIKDKHEVTDADKLFKIDLASNYKNVQYILEVLKSSDSLYVSKSLKCLWLYDDVYSNVIDPDYLHQNIFPYLSIKMKKKMLTTIHMHLKTEERIINFYNYCVKEKFTNIALKFLILTSESFKLDIIKKGVVLKQISNEEAYFFKKFFGESFTLLEAYFQVHDNRYGGLVSLLLRLRYFYSVSDVRYLELVEKYTCFDYNMCQEEFGLRISKDIMKKHKDRVLKRPLVYLPILNNKQVAKYSSVEDAKLFAVALLPRSDVEFWSVNYYQINKYILDIIPGKELFAFLKKIFTDAYPGREFETTKNFFNNQYYNMLTVEEREKWALSQIERQREVLGVGKDYEWYQFVNFDKAFEGIKKYIMITIDKGTRAEMINILVKSATTQRDVEKLLKYYYERHINESSTNKEYFMTTVISNHNIFEFDDDCWNAFNKIFYSMQIYSNSGYYYATDFKLIVAIYNITNGKEIPEQIEYILYSEFNYLYIDKLSKEKGKILFEYLINLYTDKVKELEAKIYEGDDKNRIRQYISSVLRVLDIYDKSKEECPDVIMKYIKLDWDEFKTHPLLKDKVTEHVLKEDDLIRLLKKDATLLKNEFPILKETMKKSYSFKLNKLLRKLKIYFSKDIGMEYLTFFLDILSDTNSFYSSIYTSVYGIFQLADEEFKVDFMLKYAPIEAKIDHERIDNKLLYTQQGICRYACYSRPPLPLSNILMYLKGDYVHYSIPIFNHYFVHLPRPMATKFVEASLNAPLSIQKHGLRLAFKSYSVQDLKLLVFNVWKKTKNVSLRLILYKHLFDKILNEEEPSQKELYETLKVFTSEIHEKDDQQIFDIITCLSDKISVHLRGDLLKTAWMSIRQFTEIRTNLENQVKIIRAMKSNITLMDRNFLMEFIIKPHINEMLNDKQIRPSYERSEISMRVKIKWALVARYIVTAENEMAIKESVELVTSIIKTCAEMWNEIHEKQYTIKLFCANFITSLISNSNNFYNNFKYVNCIFEKLLHAVQNLLPAQEMYLTIWELRLVIITRKVCSKLECNEFGQFENIEREKHCAEYASEIGNLVVGLVNKGQFYSIFLPKIHELIKSHIEIFSLAIREKVDYVIITICNGLTNFKISEVYTLALMLLPMDCDYNNLVSFMDTIKKIKEMEIYEIQSFLLQKYIRQDFRQRKYFDILV